MHLAAERHARRRFLSPFVVLRDSSCPSCYSPRCPNLPVNLSAPPSRPSARSRSPASSTPTRRCSPSAPASARSTFRAARWPPRWACLTLASPRWPTCARTCAASRTACRCRCSWTPTPAGAARFPSPARSTTSPRPARPAATSRTRCRPSAAATGRARNSWPAGKCATASAPPRMAARVQPTTNSS